MQPWQTYTPATDLLKGRVYLVTGAGQGIGEATALALAVHGATVILSGRSERKLARVYDAIEAAGGAKPAAVPIDLGKMSDQDCANFANLIWKEFDQLDGIVHCANGFSFLSPLINQKLEEWVEMYRVNVAAPFAISRACLPLLKRAPDPAIVIVGEQHGLEPKAYWGGFATAKAGQASFARIAADEWDAAPMPRVNLVIPGPVNSPFRMTTHPAESKTDLPTPADVGRAILWLLGPDGAARRGETVRINEADIA